MLKLTSCKVTIGVVVEHLRQSSAQLSLFSTQTMLDGLRELNLGTNEQNSIKPIVCKAQAQLGNLKEIQSKMTNFKIEFNSTKPAYN